MMHVVHLHGFMGQKYAKRVEFHAANMNQLMCGLISRFGPQFKEDVRVGTWHLTDGAVKSGNDIAESAVRPGLPLKSKHIHLLPKSVKGANSTLMAVVGIVLIVVGAFTYNPYLMAMGAGMLAGGVAGMMVKEPTTQAQQEISEKGSYIFNGAVNITAQGGPIPRGYGRIPGCAPSVVITTDFSTDEVGA